MKKDIGFRFSEEVHLKLFQLSDEWDCTRTAVIEKLVMGALARSQEVAEKEALNAAGEKLKASVAPKILPKDPKEVAEAVRTIKPPAKRGTVEPKKLSEAVADTRTQQERMDDFYRSNMAKGKK